MWAPLGRPLLPRLTPDTPARPHQGTVSEGSAPPPEWISHPRPGGWSRLPMHARA